VQTLSRDAIGSALRRLVDGHILPEIAEHFAGGTSHALAGAQALLNERQKKQVSAGPPDSYTAGSHHDASASLTHAGGVSTSDVPTGAHSISYVSVDTSVARACSEATALSLRADLASVCAGAVCQRSATVRARCWSRTARSLGSSSSTTRGLDTRRPAQITGWKITPSTHPGCGCQRSWSSPLSLASLRRSPRREY
jgi:phage-related tail fiber protein